MNLLLDTRTLLWWLDDDLTLSNEARESIYDPNSLVYVSAATAWEISLKKTLGKLDAPDNLSEALSVNAFQELPIGMDHALLAGKLPHHHSDPFDRILVAQASIENLTLVTRDTNIMQYQIAILKA